jgi:GR25 family glycosyltransferase involved in LPS biosynthesis
MNDIFNCECKVINLNNNIYRWIFAEKNISKAGFKNIKRFPAIDGKKPEILKKEWSLLGNPKFSDNDPDFNFKKGKQGCFLSHIKIWKEIIDNNIEKIIIFEDDIFFHEDWKDLSSSLFELTPKNFDLLFFGSNLNGLNLDNEILQKNILITPVFCLHSYCITKIGATKLLNYIFQNQNSGVYTIDYILFDYMNYILQNYENIKDFPLIWYVWNYYPLVKKIYPQTGLVFQNKILFQSDIENN